VISAPDLKDAVKAVVQVENAKKQNATINNGPPKLFANMQVNDDGEFVLPKQQQKKPVHERSPSLALGHRIAYSQIRCFST